MLAFIYGHSIALEDVADSSFQQIIKLRKTKWYS